MPIIVRYIAGLSLAFALATQVSGQISAQFTRVASLIISAGAPL